MFEKVVWIVMAAKVPLCDTRRIHCFVDLSYCYTDVKKPEIESLNRVKSLKKS